jgi:hypothetical protein
MSKDIRQMIDRVKNFKQFINENSNRVLNKSFNLTTIDVDNLLDGLRDEYKNLPQSTLDEYIDERREITLSLLKTNFSFDNDGVLIGIENFPKSIKLYRIIDNDVIDEKCLGRYWTYSRDYIKTSEFQNNVGFEKNKSWFIVEAIFNKNDIEPNETLEMLVRNVGEREIRLKSNCIKPIEHKIYKYIDFV